MNRIRKSATVVATASLVLAGCAGGDNHSPSADEPVTLTFASWQWLEPGRGDALWEAMTAYSDSHENVTLKQQAVPRADYESTMSTQIGSGEGPDLLIVPPAFLYQAGDAGILEPLDGILRADSEAALMSNNERGVYGGEQLGYTWEAVNWALIYNRTLLEEATVDVPTTPEELLTAAEEITAATGNPGFAGRHLTGELQPWWNDFASWPCGFGGGWASGDQLSIDSPENIKAVQLLADLHASGAMPIGDDASTFRNRFANGEIGMMIDNASVAFTVTGEDSVLSAADTGAAPLPFPTDNSSQIVNFIGVNANSEHVEVAKDFITWLFTDEGQKLAADSVFPSTVGTDTQPSKQLIEENPWIETYRGQAESSECSPLVPGFELETPEISTVVMTHLESVLTRGVPAEEALTRAQEEAELKVG